MASIRTPAAVALFLLLNLILINSATSCAPPTDSDGTCQMNMGVCFDLLEGLLHWSVGLPDTDHKCCDYLGGLVGFEAASCVCTVIKTNVMGMEIDIPYTMNLMMNHCGKEVPKDFRCA